MKALADTYLNESRQDMVLLQRHEKAKQLKQTRAVSSKHVEEFTVAAKFMDLAIGNKEEIFEVTVYVPVSMVGEVIGKDGKTIQVR